MLNTVMFKKDLVNIGDAYSEMLNSLKHTIVKESKDTIKKGGNSFNDKFAVQDGGMDERGGAKKALNDDNCGCDEEDEETKQSNVEKRIEVLKNAMAKPNISEEEKKKLQKQINALVSTEDEEEKEIQESRKIGNQILNNVMTRKTLSFDKLFRSVINENWDEGAEDDVSAFGLEDEKTDEDLGSDFGGEEGDTVTITLDKELAKKLHAALMEVIGEEDTDENEGGEDNDLDFGGEDEFGGEEDEEVPFVGKDNKVGGKVKPKSQKASSDVTDEEGTDANGYGHALYNAKKPNMGTGSGNKVSNFKQGAEYIK